MLNICLKSVVKLWVKCVETSHYYTALVFTKLRLCISAAFIQVNRTDYPHPFPHVFIKINSLVFILTHITHRYYKNNNYLYKLITINNTEIL